MAVSMLVCNSLVSSEDIIYIDINYRKKNGGILWEA